jgi:hypothetical protein
MAAGRKMTSQTEASIPLHELLGVCLTERFEPNEIQALPEFIDGEKELIVSDVPEKTVEDYGTVTVEDVEIHICLEACGDLHIQKLTNRVGVDVKSHLLTGALLVKIKCGILPKTDVRVGHLITAADRDKVVLDDARRIVNSEGETVNASHSPKLRLGLCTPEQQNE